ncbi:hypothetical protein GOODEAATRI_030328, partial [Goodea atripinnis]
VCPFVEICPVYLVLQCALEAVARSQAGGVVCYACIPFHLSPLCKSEVQHISYVQLQSCHVLFLESVMHTLQVCCLGDMQLQDHAGKHHMSELLPFACRCTGVQYLFCALRPCWIPILWAPPPVQLLLGPAFSGVPFLICFA